MNKVIESLYNDSILRYFILELLSKRMQEYENFDKAHKVKHVEIVLEEAFKITNMVNEKRKRKVDPIEVSIAVVYHDLGLKYGRKDHHLNSGIILRNDKELKSLIKPDRLEYLAQAVEDHRASDTKDPRNVIGRILSDADKEFNFEVILSRCIWANEAKPDRDSFEYSFEDTRRHIQDKYVSENGYMKRFYYIKKDKKEQEKLDRFANDEKFARESFTKVWNKLKNKK